MKDHHGRDLKSYCVKHCIESGYANISYYDFKSIAKNFSNSSWKQKNDQR